jgi:hypothetical protein
VGQLIFPEFDRKVALPEPVTTGEALASCFEQLDRIAKEIRLIPPFLTFGDSRSVPEDFAVIRMSLRKYWDRARTGMTQRMVQRH